MYRMETLFVKTKFSKLCSSVLALGKHFPNIFIHRGRGFGSTNIIFAAKKQKVTFDSGPTLLINSYTLSHLIQFAFHF